MRSREIVKTRIVIASANLMTCRLLAQELERHPDFLVVASVSDNGALLKSLQRANPDIALIAVHLQDGPFSGLSRLHDISHQFPDLPWILLLDRTEPQLVVDSFRAGARGVFSCSESEPRMLCKCIRRVVGGQVWADTVQMRYVLAALTDASFNAEHSRGQALSLL